MGKTLKDGIPSRQMQSFASYKKNLPINFSYHIHDTLLVKVDPAKYLGIIINWKKQYAHFIKSCKQTLSFKRRNIPKSPKKVKSTCYKTQRPKLEYACPVWDRHHQVHIDNIEKVRKSAARFVTGTCKMESGNSAIKLKSLGWETLEEKRLKTKYR